MEADSSGIEVPIATRVRPMVNWETPRRVAVRETASTKISDPFTRTAREAASISTWVWSATG